jgi:hypothetical protein cdivTM_00585
MFEIKIENLTQIIQIMTCITFVCIVVIALACLIIASINSSTNNRLDKILDEIKRLNNKN